jgi:hypothetical protein
MLIHPTLDKLRTLRLTGMVQVSLSTYFGPTLIL